MDQSPVLLDASWKTHGPNLFLAKAFNGAVRWTNKQAAWLHPASV